MSDDGTGRDLTIPALLISKEDGQKIKDFYLKYEKDTGMLNKITFDINFEIVIFFLNQEHKEIVEVKLFFSSEMTDIYEFLAEFYHYEKKLKSKMKLIPHYIMSAYEFFIGKEPREYRNCVSGGQFCAKAVPELNITEPIIIIHENIRQKCVLKVSDNNTELYYSYMMSFQKSCLNKTFGVMFNKTCSNKVLKELEIDENLIDTCITSSFKG